MRKQYVIYGDSPFAERIYSYIRQEDKIEMVGFTNGDSFISRDTIQGKRVIPFSEFAKELKDDCELILAYGYTKMNDLREKVYLECIEAGCHIGTFISSHAMVYSKHINEGTIILPGTVVGPSSVIGRCCILEAGCVISHDSIVGDFCYFSSGVIMGGRAAIGNHCFLGLNSTIRNGIKLADYTLIGAASNVLYSTEKNSVYVGNPSKKIAGKAVETKR